MITPHITKSYLLYFHYPKWNIRFGIRWPVRWRMPPPTAILCACLLVSWLVGVVIGHLLWGLVR